MIIEGLQYGFGELYGRTKPRGVRNDFFKNFFKRPINLKNWVFATKSNVLTPISSKPDGVNQWYFKLRSFGCKDMGIRKF